MEQTKISISDSELETKNSLSELELVPSIEKLAVIEETEMPKKTSRREKASKEEIPKEKGVTKKTKTTKRRESKKMLIDLIHRVETDQIDRSTYLVPISVLKKHGILEKVRERRLDGFEGLEEYFNNDPFRTNKKKPILYKYLVESVPNLEVQRGWFSWENSSESSDENSNTDD